MLFEKSVQNNESANVNELIPRQIRLDAAVFTNLLKEYYNFLNEEGNPTRVINRIIAEHDLDKVYDDKYLDAIRKEIANGLPTSTYVQKTFLLKRIVDAYSLRGTEASIEFFFRIFFGEDPTIYRPWEHVLMPSQGTWTIGRRARIVLHMGNEDILRNNTLVQYDPFGNLRASLAIKSVRKQIFGEAYYFDIEFYTDAEDTFSNGLPVQTADGLARGRLIRSLASVNIVDAGLGYSPGDRIFIGGKERISFGAVVNTTGPLGQITSVVVVDPGLCASINYEKEISNDPRVIVNGSDVYLHGMIRTNGQVYFDTAPTDTLRAIGDPFRFEIANEDAAIVEANDIPVDIHATVSDAGLTILSVEQKISDTILYDFEYFAGHDAYGEPIEHEFDSSTKAKPLSDVVIMTNKVDPFDNTAYFTFTFDTVFLTEGRYTTDKGRPSGVCVLQDSFYYQVFSYEVTCGKPMSEWLGELKNFVHPAGLKAFGHVRSTILSDVGSEFTASINDTDYLYSELRSILFSGVSLTNDFEIELGEDLTSEDPYGALYGSTDPYDPFPSYKFFSSFVFGDGSDFPDFNPETGEGELDAYEYAIYYDDDNIIMSMPKLDRIGYEHKPSYYSNTQQSTGLRRGDDDVEASDPTLDPLLNTEIWRRELDSAEWILEE